MNKKGGAVWIFIALIVAVIGLVVLLPFFGKLEAGSRAGIELTGVNVCRGTGMSMLDYTYWLNGMFRTGRPKKASFDYTTGVDFCTELLSCFGSEKRLEKQLRKSAAVCCFKFFRNEIREYFPGEYNELLGKVNSTRCKYG